MKQNGQIAGPRPIPPIEKLLIIGLVMMILGAFSIALVEYIFRIDIVEIRLVGPNNVPLPHQIVTLRRTDIENQRVRSVITDDSGSAYFWDIMEGQYEIGIPSNNEIQVHTLERSADGTLTLEITPTK